MQERPPDFDPTAVLGTRGTETVRDQSRSGTMIALGSGCRPSRPTHVLVHLAERVVAVPERVVELQDGVDMRFVDVDATLNTHALSRRYCSSVSHT